MEPSKGDKVWKVTGDGTIDERVFCEASESGDRKYWMLAYGKHPRQRNWVETIKCFTSRAEACAAAAKILRLRAKFCIDEAERLEQEAAGLPVKPRDLVSCYLPKKEE